MKSCSFIAFLMSLLANTVIYAQCMNDGKENDKKKRDCYDVIDIDFSTGYFNRPTPFDEPFFIRGRVDDITDVVTLKIKPKINPNEQHLYLVRQEEIFNWDRTKKANADTISKFVIYVDKFLEAGKSYDFKIEGNINNDRKGYLEKKIDEILNYFILHETTENYKKGVFTGLPSAIDSLKQLFPNTYFTFDKIQIKKPNFIKINPFDLEKMATCINSSVDIMNNSKGYEQVTQIIPNFKQPKTLQEFTVNFEKLETNEKYRSSLSDLEKCFKNNGISDEKGDFIEKIKKQIKLKSSINFQSNSIGTTSLGFENRTKSYIAVDIGGGGFPVLNHENQITSWVASPYLGMSFYFNPVNKYTSLGAYKGDWKYKFRKSFSVGGGILFDIPNLTNSRVKFMLGGFYRLTSAIKVGFGGVFDNFSNKTFNQTVTNQRILPFISISLDNELRELIPKKWQR